MQTYQESSDFVNFLKSTPYREVIRKQWYSYVAYPTAGQSTFNFFGDALSSTTNAQFTNMPKANSFADSYFLIKQITTKMFIGLKNPISYTGTDATTLSADILAGFAQAGYLDFSVGSRSFVQVPKPFLYMAAATEPLYIRGGGNIDANTGCIPYVEPQSCAPFLLDPALAIEPDANFSVSINYPSGVIPIIASSIVTNNTTLYVGVEFDGIWARKLQ